MKILYCIILFLLLGLFSCVKDKPQNPVEPLVSISGGHKVYITNEGRLGYNDAGVSLYDLGSGQVVSDIYKTQNNNAVLGDVCQSMTKANNNYYVVVNNSGKIVVVNQDNFKLKGTIGGLKSPRYILPITFQKGYVSNLYSDTIFIVDLNSFTKTGSIPCKGWTEQMALFYNKAFITNMRSNSLYVINTINDQITDSINVGINAGSIVLDKNSKVWVLSTGDKTNNIPGKLSRINPITLQVELVLPFANVDSPQLLCSNAGKDTLYFLNSNVYRMEISSNVLPSGVFINNSSNKFYGLSVNDKDYNIYLSDAIDYVQKSSIMVYTPSGQLKTTFKAGINASGFYFE